MKSLLIVEDEKMIRQGLRVMIQRSGVPVDVILECRNGEEALGVLETQQIDVMFTDIRMPRMDGIELTKRAQGLPHPPLIVAVSGYDDFSYAVEMLRNGVREYLLKPVDRDKIQQIMQQLEQELAQRRENYENELLIGRQQMRHLLSGADCTPEEMQTLKQKYDSLFYEGSYVVCCGEKEGEAPGNPGVILLENVDDGYVYVLEEEDLPPFLKNELPDGAAGISRPYQGLEHLREAYREAAEARKRAFCIGRAVNGTEEPARVPQGLRDEAAKLLNEQNCSQRIQLVGSGRTEELDRQWGRLFAEVAQERIAPDDFFQMLQETLQEIGKIYGDGTNAEWKEEQGRLMHILAYADLQQYREVLMDWIMEIHREKNNKEEGTVSDRKMQMAVEYIAENYNKDLNMAVVSNYLSMNYSQFSYSFKQYTGESFVNYLKEIRIREAKRLLAETDLKVQEISMMVGYENEKHFMKTFRSQCGVSATEYRKNMKKEEV